MPQQARMLLAVSLSLFIFFAWYRWISPAPKPPAKSAVQSVAESQAGTQPSHDAPAKGGEEGAGDIADPQASVAEQKTVISTDRLMVELSNVGAGPVSWRLRKYVRGAGEEMVDLVTNPSSAQFAFVGDLLEGIVPTSAHYTVERSESLKVVYRWRGNDVEVTKTYVFKEGSYLADIDVSVKNMRSAPLHGRLAMSWVTTNPQAKKSGFLGFLQGPPDVWGHVYYKDGKASRISASTNETGESFIGRVYWGGVENRYYLAAILPRSQTTEGEVTTSGQVNEGAASVSTTVAGSILSIPAGSAANESFSIYCGPKQLDELKGAGFRLDQAIDYGWFGFAAIPLLYLLKFFYQVVHNYGVAIILLTLFVKLVLHPITKSSMKSMRKMQVLQPRLKELREKYKNDREKLNAETMQLFKSQGVNPMGGCLPMVLQIPVYIALYKVLWNSIELYRAPFFGFYRDLSAPDPYFISPALLGVTFFLQQKLTPSPSADPAQQKMMQFMPVMFTAFMVFLPSGLVIYIFVNTLFTVLQQWLMNRGLGFRDLLKGNLSPKAI